MKAFDTSQSLIDINETTKKHAEIVPSRIGAHTPSVCDYIPDLSGVINKTVIKHLKHQNLSLPSLK